MVLEELSRVVVAGDLLFVMVKRRRRVFDDGLDAVFRRDDTFNRVAAFDRFHDGDCFKLRENRLVFLPDFL